MMDVNTFKQLMGVQPSWLDVWFGFLEPQVATVSQLCSANPSDPGAPPLPLNIPAFGLPPLPSPAFFNWAVQKMQYFSFTQVCQCSTSACSGQVFLDSGWSAFAAGSGDEEICNTFTVDQVGVTTDAFYLFTAGVSTAATVDLWDTAVSSAPIDTTASNTAPAGGHSLTNWSGGTHALTNGHSYYICVRKHSGSGYPGLTPNPLPLMNPYGHISGDHANAGGFLFPNVALGALVGVQPNLCGNTPTAATVPPVPSNIIFSNPPTCSTNTDICAILNQIQLQVQENYALTTLLQRRARPFAFISGTTTTGLTGAGTIAVQDIVGAIVSVTAHTAGWGSTADNPARFIPTLGSIQASDGVNFDDWRQIHYLHEVVDLPSWATVLNYSFRAGVTASITLLLPEP